MKFCFSFILSFIIILTFFSCKNDDSDLWLESGEVNDTILFNTTPLQEKDSVPAFDKDYYENSRFTRLVEIDYNKDSASVVTSYSGIVVKIEGAQVTIRTNLKGIHYVVAGETENGFLKIYSEYKFLISLNGLKINNPSGPAINSQCRKAMYIDIAEGTLNNLGDGDYYMTSPSEDTKGTLFSEGQIIFSGKGELNVDGCCNNAIASDDYIVFRPGNVVNVKCIKKSCIKANDGISIRGSVLNLNADGDGNKGIDTDADVYVSGGRTIVVASGKGIDAGGKASFSGGETYLFSSECKPVDIGKGLTLSSGLKALFSLNHKLLQIK